MGRLMPADMSTGSGSGPGGRRDESFAGGRNGSKRDNDFTDTGVEDGLRLLASSRSAGKKMSYDGSDITVQELGKDSFKDIDIALFSAGGSQSKE